MMRFLANESRNKRGFTAVEIAMVATVIAIIALLVLPIFRTRAEEARRVAAEDELASLAKALLLVEADLPGGNALVRLNDLDNRERPDLSQATPANQFIPDLAPPFVFWNRVAGEFDVLTDASYFGTQVNNWRGPYIAVKRAVSLLEIQNQFPLMLDTASGNSGPITIVGVNAPAFSYNGGNITDDLDNDRYPVDPWGNPYLLFGPEETVYNVRLLFSLGPNGAPGNDINPVAADFDRRLNVLGSGDDLEFRF